MAKFDDTHSIIPGDFILDRITAVPKLVGDPRDLLLVSGLAGAGKDTAQLTDDGANSYILGGAMGAAVSMGLGLALARKDKRVLVITGDGELIMNVGALAVVGVMNPSNLAILCVDNGYYGETGYQRGQTSLGVDLEMMAKGAGIRATRTIRAESELEEGARLLRSSNSASFVLLRVKPTDPPPHGRSWDGDRSRNNFRNALLGKKAGA